MYDYYAYVDEVIDGDSLRVTIDLGFNIKWKKQQLRLYGLNTPESFRPKSDLEDEAGHLVKNYLKSMIEGKQIAIKSFKENEIIESGKFGRYLCRVFVETEDSLFCLNDLLITLKLAKPYFGKKREEWKEEELKHIINSLSDYKKE